MVLNRSSTEEGNDNSDSSSGARQKVSKYVSQEEFIQEVLAKVETTFRRVVRQELEAKLELLGSSQRGSFVKQPESSTSRTLQLIFANRLQSTFFTNSKIVNEGHSFVTVQLVDANSGEVINYAPFCSVRVEIFAIKGDFSVDGQKDLSNNSHDGVVCGRKGRPPLLGGELSFSLTHGVGYIENVIFTDNSSWLRSRRFRLGVRAVPNTLDGVRIKEGISEAFVVLEQRGEPNQKHEIPFLDDPLWRLKKISKTGALCTKLAQNGIHTVQDFLKLYNVNSKRLRDIVGSGIGQRSWETIVKNANACCLDNNLYSYCNADGVGLVVNSVYKVLVVTFDGGISYQTIDALDSQQTVEVELLKQYIHCNQNVLSLTNGSSSTYPPISSQFQNSDPFYAPFLDPWANVPPITNEGISGCMLDVSHSYPSCSNPYMTYESYQHEENISTHSGQPFESADWDSSYQPCSDEAYGWNLINSTVFTVETIENFVAEPSTLHPVGTWATASASNAQCSYPLQSVGINSPTGGKSKARWLKVRSVLMWKIVKRDAAAKKKGKFVPGYYQGLCA